jgi:hypothetical protein
MGQMLPAYRSKNATWRASINGSDVTSVSLKEFDVEGVDVHVLVRVV